MNNEYPSKETVDEMRQIYTKGSRVELLNMNDPYVKQLYPGYLGTVVCVDSIGTIFVNWDCGIYLGVAYGIDSCYKI